MSQKLSIKSLTMCDKADKYVDQQVQISGQVCWLSDTKGAKFVKLYDTWQTYLYPIQLYFDKKVGRSPFDDVSLATILRIQKGWHLTVTGTFIKSPKAGQPHEIHVKSLDALPGEVYDYKSYLLASDDYTLYALQKHPEYQASSPIFSTIWGLSSELTKCTHRFFDMMDFSYTYTPLISFSECEAGCQPLQFTQLLREGLIWKLPKANSFQTMQYDFFGKPAYATVSSQLELRTFLQGMGPCWTMTTAVRGEKSATRSHLAEFRMIEAEFESSDEFHVASVAEKYIQFCLSELLFKFEPYLDFLAKQTVSSIDSKSGVSNKVSRFDPDRVQKLKNYASKPFDRITHAQAITILLEQHEKDPFKTAPKYDDDLAKEHEIYLTDIHFKHPVIIYRFPENVKAFYMPYVQEDDKESYGVRHVRCFDILVPGVGELVGGSSRIHKHDELMEKIASREMDAEPLKFFTDMCQYGTFPHGGFGIGYERFVMLLCGCIIHDTVGFPRYYDGTTFKELVEVQVEVPVETNV